MNNVKTKAPYEPEWVTLTEYIRRKHQQDLLKDALARPVSSNTVRSKMKAGHIKFTEEGGRRFIDWKKYADFPLRTYFQMPTREIKTVQK